MRFDRMYPMVMTDKLEESRDFYAALGFQAVFYNGWYLHLRRGGEGGQEIGFLKPEHESQPPPFRPAFRGEGLAFGFEVADVEAAYAEAKAQGWAIALELRQEPWGQKYFAVTDPNGIAIDVIQPVEPDAAWMAAQPDMTRPAECVFV